MKAKTASNAILYGEAGQDFVDFVALTDDGDHLNFNSADELWSDASGKTPDIKPNGLASGGAVTEAVSGSNDVVDVAGLTCYLAGVLTTVVADADFAVTRGDATHLLLTLAAAGYTNCVASDIGKTVVGGTTTDSGILIAYNNTTRQWIIDQVDENDDFDDDDEAITITTGTGAGSMEGVAVAAPYKICSITVASNGALALVQGYQGTAFSTTRGAIGGPPFIATTSIEIGQVKYTSLTAAPVDADEIKQIVGTHCERFDSPTYDAVYARVESGALGYAGVLFRSALPLIHTGGVAKKVYAAYYTPAFSEIPNAADFVAPSTSYSVSSEQVYGGVVGSESQSLSAGSFAAKLENGVNDFILLMADDTLWFKFYPDRLVTGKYRLCQGKVGVVESYGAGASMSAAVTIAASEAAKRVYA